jgi:HPt (histidine-containing phosphotransfer) domain-containing protein
MHFARGDFDAIAAELHTLAGEAALLQLREIVELAREGEGLARKGGAPEECDRVLHALEARIAVLPKT